MQPLHHLPPNAILGTAWSRADSYRVRGGQGTLPFIGLDDELSALRDEVARLQADNARLRRLLELTPRQAGPLGPVQTGVFDGDSGPVHADSAAAAKAAFFASLFAARTDVYALRWENARTGRAGWVPAAGAGAFRPQSGSTCR
jgi:hypothetical protein